MNLEADHPGHAVEIEVDRIVPAAFGEKGSSPLATRIARPEIDGALIAREIQRFSGVEECLFQLGHSGIGDGPFAFGLRIQLNFAAGL